MRCRKRSVFKINSLPFRGSAHNLFVFLNLQHISLIDARKDYWKEMRKALSPTFTSGKIKSMFAPIDGVVNRMVDHMEKKRKESADSVVDVKPIFQGLSLDSISNCAFGVETDSFNNPGNKLFKTCLNIFVGFTVQTAFESLMLFTFSFFPFLQKFMDTYGDKKQWDYLWDMTKEISEKRTHERGDFIDRIKEIKKQGILNEYQTYAQGIGFFQAGFETTSNTLSTLTYALAKNPDVQEELFREVEEVMSKIGDGKMDHETVQDMPYTEACLYENLRLNGPVTRVDRLCLRDSQLGNMKIKEGTLVQVPIWAVHHDPELYPEPDRFDPSRFLGEGGKAAASGGDFKYLAFGGGPRLCIGMRWVVENKW